MTQLRVPVATCLALALLVLAGCGEKSVQTYTVSKEKPQPAAPGTPAAPASGELPPGHPPIGGMPATQPGADPSALPPGHPPIGGGAMSPVPAMPGAATQGANSITWAAPDHWVAKPLGAMRRGSFTVKGQGGDADLSIFLFAAASNPLLANINRWRGQVGLAPITEAQVATESTTIEGNGLKFAIVDLLGKQPGSETSVRVLGAVLYRGEEAWFFKLGGPDAVVASEKAAFLDFLRTVRVSN